MDNGLSDEALNVSLVWMGAHWVLEEQDSSQVSACHERHKFGVTTERTGLAGGTENDIGFVLEYLGEHLHGALGSCQAELFQNVLVLKDKVLHSGFHPVVGNESEAAHIIWTKGRLKVMDAVGAFCAALFHIWLKVSLDANAVSLALEFRDNISKKIVRANGERAFSSFRGCERQTGERGTTGCGIVIKIKIRLRDIIREIISVSLLGCVRDSQLNLGRNLCVLIFRTVFVSKFLQFIDKTFDLAKDFFIVLTPSLGTFLALSLALTLLLAAAVLLCLFRGGGTFFLVGHHFTHDLSHDGFDTDGLGFGCVHFVCGFVSWCFDFVRMVVANPKNKIISSCTALWRMKVTKISSFARIPVVFLVHY